MMKARATAKAAATRAVLILALLERRIISTGEAKSTTRENELGLEQSWPLPVHPEESDCLEESHENTDGSENVGAEGGDRDRHNCRSFGEGSASAEMQGRSDELTGRSGK